MYFINHYHQILQKPIPFHDKSQIQGNWSVIGGLPYDYKGIDSLGVSYRSE